jgi:hypothetical protein
VLEHELARFLGIRGRERWRLSEIGEQGVRVALQFLQDRDALSAGGLEVLGNTLPSRLR